MKSITARQHEGVWLIRGFTRPYIDILKANQCAWDGKQLVWVYSGSILPAVIQHIVDGTYGFDANNPVLAPNNANSEKQVSEAESPVSRTKRPYSGKDTEAYWEQLANHGQVVEWSTSSGTFRGICQKVENGVMMRVLTVIGRVELVIPFELLRPVSLFTKSHIEPDGTCPYMVENQRNLKPGQDWLGWMTCCECGVFLDLESNRVNGKPLMGIGNGKVICPDCHRAKHNLPEIQIDESKAKPVFDTTLYGFLEGHWHIKQAGVESAICGVDWYGLGIYRQADEMQLTPMCRTCIDIAKGLAVVLATGEIKSPRELNPGDTVVNLHPIKPSFAPKSRVTPLRQQYLDIKAQYPDYLVAFQLGDFFEMFDTDAEIAACDLDLVLTGRPVSKSERVPMAGFPCHSAEQYFTQLVKKGHVVVVVEQVGEIDGRGIVERKVTRIIEANGDTSEVTVHED